MRCPLFGTIQGVHTPAEEIDVQRRFLILICALFSFIVPLVHHSFLILGVVFAILYSI